MSELKQYTTHSRDIYGNTILHLAGKLAPPHKLNLVSGAALQMQCELQWFKEVEKFVIPADKEIENNCKKTSAMLFSEEHKDLVSEGEKWMKDTANSCTIAAALIATIVFAAAITVSEQDFLYILPKSLTIGLVSLFLSITSMMITFSATFYLVFGHKKAWILIPVAALACLPVTLFVSLQFPLLVDVISSTFGPGIFGKQSGNNLDGLPNFSKEIAFIIFAVSDAISLFASIASLLMFLSILTSSYAEQDFLYTLPNRLTIGLVTLFLSITTMIITFSATLYLVFGHKKTWILIPVAGLACLPVTLFISLQFPLLVDVISSTYGPGIFGKKSERPFY
ncbi:uncharacterized protein LOC132278151 [Cornus florida]|uniref:uncharacterized protein LOC132278151 n=1 Tax=Cornus florida TaxID=4283 RepID=UPI0028A22F28|nr:uncharacterized protein LOC132278151 [Cornus florida]